VVEFMNSFNIIPNRATKCTGREHAVMDSDPHVK
jgi:hypothetical protein